MRKYIRNYLLDVFNILKIKTEFENKITINDFSVYIINIFFRRKKEYINFNYNSNKLVDGLANFLANFLIVLWKVSPANLLIKIELNYYLHRDLKYNTYAEFISKYKSKYKLRLNKYYDVIKTKYIKNFRCKFLVFNTND